MPWILFVLMLLSPVPRLETSVGAVYLDAGPGGVTWNGKTYLYGRRPRPDAPENGDAFLTVRDEASGDVLHEVLYDGGNDETFIYFAILAEDVFALVTETRGIPGSGGSSLRKTEILTFTAAGEPLGSASVPGLMAAYNNHGHLLVLSEDTDYRADYVFDADLAPVSLPDEILAEGSFTYPYRGFATIDGVDVPAVALTEPGAYAIDVTDGEYHYRFTAIVAPIVAGIADNGEYDAPVTISAAGELMLDGEPFMTGGEVAAPGIHALTIRGANGYAKTVGFVIHPYVANVAEGFRTTAGIRIFSNAPELTLDGSPYESGDLVRTAGNHVLRIYAANGYERTVSFAILPSVAGLEDGATYAGGVSFDVNGTAVLGGLAVTGYVEVSTPGDHELTLYFDGEPYSTYRFKVTAAPREAPWWETFPLLEVACGALAVVGLFLIFRKK